MTRTAPAPATHPAWAVGVRDVIMERDGESSQFITGPSTAVPAIDGALTVRAEQFTASDGYADDPHVTVDNGTMATMLTPAQARAVAVALTAAADLVDAGAGR
ncbi:DUF6907 domain-containing protein [Actinotalea fermentans]|uniref:Uncharacterized protein n=1 Tax=Actinotalea fermentans TaxID=43671 RepID=A0A511YU69_9CELL|nr:hypothetical protein [Actinotalea fermentans]GEN78716.1 hypothetical protein AFE02nite_04500 [Actinotalea fermentans]